MNEDAATTRVYRFCRVLVRGVARIYHRIRATGLEHVPAEGGCILAANHASFLDPPLLGCMIPHRFIYCLARDSLFRHPVAGWLLRKLFVIPMDREKGDVGALKQALRLLKEGRCLALYPEGTRTRDGNLQPAKGGVGFLILKARLPVIPVYLDGTYQSFSRHAKWIRPHRVTVRFGQPIPPEEFDALPQDKEKYTRASELVMARIAALNDAG